MLFSRQFTIFSDYLFNSNNSFASASRILQISRKTDTGISLYPHSHLLIADAVNIPRNGLCGSLRANSSCVNPFSLRKFPKFSPKRFEKSILTSFCRGRRYSAFFDSKELFPDLVPVFQSNFQEVRYFLVIQAVKYMIWAKYDRNRIFCMTMRKMKNQNGRRIHQPMK